MHLLLLFSSKSCNPYNLGVGSAVEFLDLEQYGVIKWIGNIPGSKEIFAGLEMVCKHEKHYGNERLFIKLL